MVKINQLREKIDELINQNKIRLDSSEMVKCYDNLRLAKGWLGKFKGLQRMGKTYAVASSEKDIPCTKESSINKHYKADLFSDLSRLAFVNTVREIILEIIKDVESSNVYEIDMNIQEQSTKDAANYIFYTKKSLEEARMWLGFELGRMRDAVNI